MLFKLSFSNLKKSMKDYAVYFFTLILGVAIFYIFNAIETQSAMLTLTADTREIVKLISTMLSGVSVFVACVLGFLIIYASNFLMKRRKKEFGLYMLLGMGKRKVSLILFIETLIIGVISLGIGLILGIGLSQVTSIFVANMFGVSIEKYRFVFSNTAFAKTLIYFVIIYVVVILFNTMCINRFRLIDLLVGSKKSEKTRLKNPYVCTAIFTIAAVMLGYAYYKVCDINNITDTKVFACYIAMGCIGTFLIFWSLSGLLFTIVHSAKGIYYKGLNSFVFRQMSSKINSNVMSMTVICLMMFITICVLSSGLTVRNSLAHNLDMLAPVDVELDKWIKDVEQNDNDGDLSEAYIRYGAMSLDEYLSDKGFDIKSYLAEYEEVSIYHSTDFNMDDTLGWAAGHNNDNNESESATGNSMSDSVNGFVFLNSNTPEDMMSVSDYNRLAKLYGSETIELADDEYEIVADYKNMVNIRNAAMNNGMDITVDGRNYHSKSGKCLDGIIEISGNHINTGIFIVPDNAVAGMKPVRQMLIGNYNQNALKNKAVVDEKILAWDKVDSLNDASSAYMGFGVNTRADIRNSAMGLGAMVAFIALYIGMIFLISGAAILALKELSESADNMGRYEILKELGTDNRQINGAVLKQTTIFFGLPMILAIIHSVFGMKVSYLIIEALGTEYMVQSMIMTGILILIVYGGYFVLTYNSCRNMIRDI